MVVINIMLYTLNSHIEKFDREVEKCCILSFQDPTFKVSQKL